MITRKEKRRRYRVNHNDKYLEGKRRYAKRHPEKNCDKKRRERYGLTKEQFAAMLQHQGGLCAICTLPLVPGRGTHIDHNAATGTIRGLLCGNCNRGLGCFKENSAALETAVEYLLRSKA